MSKPKTPTPTRVYLVTDHAGWPRLVDASSPGQAVAHVYGDAGLVAIPSQKKLIELATAGIKVETVTKAPTDQPALPLGEPVAGGVGPDGDTSTP